MMTLVKHIAVFVLVLILHNLFDWLVPLTACFLLAGLVLDEYIVLTVTLSGFLVNGIPTIYAYFMYSESAAKITEDLSIILGNIDATAILLVSLAIPAIMYAIAGVFAWQVAEIRRKLRA
jgi:hypothetical protein